MKTVLTTILSAFLFIFLTILPGPAHSVEDADIGPDPRLKVVVSVGDVDITEENLQIHMQRLIPKLAFHSSVSERRMKIIREKAIEELISDIVILREAKELNVTVKESDVKRAVNQIKKRTPRGQSFKDILKNSNMTIKDFKDELRDGFIKSKLKTNKKEEFAAIATETVNKAYLKDYYEKNLPKFVEPARLRVSEILIKADPSGGNKAWSASYKKSKSIYDILMAGGDYVELAKEHSEDQFAEKGGDLGWVHEGSLTPEVDKALSMIKKGEITTPIRTLYGFHVFKIVDRQEAHQKAFEHLNHANLTKELHKKESERLWNEWFAAISKKVKIVRHDNEDK